MRVGNRPAVHIGTVPVVATVQRLVPGADPEGQARRWAYWTEAGTWSLDIMEAKTWSRGQIRFADAVAARTLGAVVSMHQV